MVGPVLPNQPMEKMVLVLRPDPAQEEALDELIRAQQDPASPFYHQWLTPEAFGERFGVSQSDLDQVAGWLEMHGMKVDEIPPSRRSIIFSGTSGQVETAFHTQMRKYSVRGHIHFANATDPEIPQALAGVVIGIVSLHDFHSAPQHTMAPAFTLANGAHILVPGDWDTIYDVTPLYSQGLDGIGQSIAVVGRTDVSLTDVQTFRTNAALPTNSINVPQKIFVDGINPGMPDCGDEEEAALDVEWAGAIARNATIKFVSAASGATDGVILAAQYAVANNVAPIVTMSYGHCENTLSGGGLHLWGDLWSQAASQGQSVFVSSGDTGAAGCDLAEQVTATQGKSVNAICSTPNSTCVGGTEFNDINNPGVYWSATNGPGQASVLSYIPELAWNETSWSGMIGTASGGGISTVYAKPGWQSAPGVPSGAMRYVPDIAATSAVNDAYVIQVQGAAYYAGGTSAATASLASVMALVLQNAGAPLGSVNPGLYTLASQQAAGGPAVFHDVTSGNNTVPGVSGYSAGTGYDMVTGLGSIDAFLLVNSWSNIRASNFTLASTSSSLTVSPNSSATATLTMSAQGGFNSPVTLSAAGAPSGVTVAFTSPTLTPAAPATMTVTADANVVASSCPIAVTGTGGGFKRTVAFALTVAAPNFTLTPSPASASVNVGNSTSFTLTLAGLNGFNLPVALSIGGTPQGVTATLSPARVTPGYSSTLTVSVASGTVAGTYALVVTSTGGNITQTQSVVVTVANPNLTLASSAASASLAPGGSVRLTLTTTAGTGFNSTVYFSVSGVPTGVTASFSQNSIAAPGTGSSTLTLSADASAPAGVFTLTIVAVGGGTTKLLTFSLTILSPSLTLALGAAGIGVMPGESLSTTVATTAANGFNSIITLSANGLPVGATATFSPSTIAAPGTGGSTITISAGYGAAPGVYTLTVAAAGGGLTRSQTLILTILAPDFSLTLTPSATSVSVAPGGSTQITVSTVVVSGFNSAIGLSVTGAPESVTASLSPASIAAPGSGSSTLTITAAPGASALSGTLTITASGGGTIRTQTLNVTASPTSGH
ncbi:MAG: protease pro-enzyme activation domain-containing protein [Acidobacteriota bacterium]|nr:protease pro-enzyme activation domain-containing protein [Acidobacteriota bacterium]